MQDNSPSHHGKQNQCLIARWWWDTKHVKLDEFTSLKAEREHLLQQIEEVKQKEDEVKQKEDEVK
jgi:hypothetical protein